MSIEQSANVLKDRNITRFTKLDSNLKQITLLDQRYYQYNDEYFPSVSHILSCYPKGKYFEDWLKSYGLNADAIAEKAAFEGTQVHNAIEQLLLGKEIKWIDSKGHANYSLDVWKMILKFIDFYNTFQPEIISSEKQIYSVEHKYAGTTDLVLKIKDKIYLMDIKTSNSLHYTYDLQLAAYKVAWEEREPIKIDEVGILWLKASTRGYDKKGEKIQGEGWQFKQLENIDESFKIFKHVQAIYLVENPECKPYSKIYPTSVKIK